MRILIFAIAFVLCGVGVANATPWGMAKNASIEVEDGQLSFCMPTPDANGISIDSVWVAENNLNNGVRHTMWDIEVLPNAAPISLKPGDCLKYGIVLPGYRENVPARKLEVGVTYSFRLNRFLEDARRTDVLFYTVVFCPVASNDGGVKYLPYIYEDSGRVVKPICEGG